MIKPFKDRIKVHTSPSGTQYVDPAEARALMFDLDSMIRERVEKYLAHISQLEEERR